MLGGRFATRTDTEVTPRSSSTRPAILVASVWIKFTCGPSTISRTIAKPRVVDGVDEIVGFRRLVDVAFHLEIDLELLRVLPLARMRARPWNAMPRSSIRSISAIVRNHGLLDFRT